MIPIWDGIKEHTIHSKYLNVLKVDVYYNKEGGASSYVFYFDIRTQVTQALNKDGSAYIPVREMYIHPRLKGEDSIYVETALPTVGIKNNTDSDLVYIAYKKCIEYLLKTKELEFNDFEFVTMTWELFCNKGNHTKTIKWHNQKATEK